MSVPSRKNVREAWAAVLTNTITAATADNIYGDQPSSLDGASPIVVVASAGADRTGTGSRNSGTFDGGPIAFFDLDVYAYVLATSDADDLLDTLEQQIAQAVTNTQAAQRWTAIVYRGPTQTKFLQIADGTQYKFEVTPLRFTSRTS